MFIFVCAQNQYRGWKVYEYTCVNWHTGPFFLVATSGCKGVGVPCTTYMVGTLASLESTYLNLRASCASLPEQVNILV
jgi:hypothetical protein